MPLPIAVPVTGVIVGGIKVIRGVLKAKSAKEKMESVQIRHTDNIKRVKSQEKETLLAMDKLGKKELEIISTFEKFSNLFEQIHNKPEFGAYEHGIPVLSKQEIKEMKEISINAAILLGGLGGAALGTAGGVAAAGATTTLVMAFGAASTGTAISGLSGAAATNAVLAWLGGGSIATGGGGMAAGAAVLGVVTLGVGLLVGGFILDLTGNSLSKKVDEAQEEMERAEEQIDIVCIYLDDLKNVAENFYQTLEKIEKIYKNKLNKLEYIIETLGRTDWNEYEAREKKLVETLVLLVSLLNNMCKVKLILKIDDKEKVNSKEINAEISKAKKIMNDAGLTVI